MIANVYQIFRNLTGDTATPYAIVDLNALKFLDEAIEKFSRISNYTFYETVSIDQTDIDAGYFEMAREVVQIPQDQFWGRGRVWEYGGGKKIRLVAPGFTPQTLSLYYRAKYIKFNGVILNQDQMDLPTEAELPVAMYAIGAWAKTTAAQVDDGSSTVITSLSNIREKAEENMRVAYGFDGGSTTSVSGPDAIMEKAVELMRDLSMAQDAVFSVFNA